jgi:regulator of protease activity HflC (stomatin/prohibitin superfamily)
MTLMRLTLSAITIIALSACATVPAGHSAVLLRVSGVDPEPLRDGEHFIGPLGVVETYDLQAQEQSEDLDALSADGMMLEAHASVMTFHPVPAEVVFLAREVGPDYYRVLVSPVVRSTLRRVLAAFRADALDTPGIGRAEAEVTADTARCVRPYHIVFDSITLRTLRIAPLSESYRAVLETGVREQEAISARQLPELARQRAEELRSEARGIAESHALIAPTITPEILTDLANQAWSKLLTAASTNVEVRPDAQPYVLEIEP